MAPDAKPLPSVRASHYIFAAVFLFRLIALARLSASPFLLPSRGDMHFYDDWAQRILHGEWTDHLAFYGLPGYAYLLAAIYKLFGYGPFLPGLLQAGLEGGTATLLYKISLRVFGNETPERLKWRIFADSGKIIGLTAAIGWGLFVPAQAYSVILMPTAWLVFAFWFLVWRVVEHDRPWDIWVCGAYGLLIGLVATGIATILFLLPLLIAAIVLRRGGQFSFSRPALAIAALFAGIFLGTSPCWIHNYFVAHDRVFLSAHSGINFWIGNNPSANGYPRIPPGLRAGQSAMLQDSITVAAAAAGHPLRRSEVSAYWSAKASAYVRSHFREWLKVVAAKGRNFWSAFQYDDLSIVTSLREEGVILPGLRFGLVAALAIPGILLSFVRLPRSRWIAAAIVLHMLSLLTVFVTERYRLAVVPGLLLFAAFTIWKLFDFVGRSQVRAASGLAAGICVSTWFVSLPQRDPSLWALDAYNAGWQALETNDTARAEKHLTLAYRYVPENTEINLALGNLWYGRKDFSKAKSFYRAVLELEPRHKSALSNLGVIALDEEHWEAAVGLFRRVVEIAPAEAKSHYLLARALLGANRLEAARIEISRARELEPAYPEFSPIEEQIRERTQL
ncbi:MAG: tetratricopeptide repeat protein [Chthoniobacterales bacterium]